MTKISATISGASGGYLVSYPFVAALTGRLAERRWDRPQYRVRARVTSS